MPTASRRHRSSSASLLRRIGCLGPAGWPRFLGLGTKSTSRTHTDTEAFETPSSAAISFSVQDFARSSLARARSTYLPPYPMAGSWREGVAALFDFQELAQTL